jgi:hypothetical protein
MEDAVVECEETGLVYDSLDWKEKALAAGWGKLPKTKKGDPNTWTDKERDDIVQCLTDYTHDMEPDRDSVKEEYGSDVVLLMKQLTKWLRQLNKKSKKKPA